jgi:hypothetical protein
MVGPGVPGSAAGTLGHSRLMMLCSFHAAGRAVITRNGLSHVAAKATEAAAPQATEASTTAARCIAERLTHGYEPTRGAARLIGSR